MHIKASWGHGDSVESKQRSKFFSTYGLSRSGSLPGGAHSLNVLVLNEAPRVTHSQYVSVVLRHAAPAQHWPDRFMARISVQARSSQFTVPLGFLKCPHGRPDLQSSNACESSCGGVAPTTHTGERHRPRPRDRDLTPPKPMRHRIARRRTTRACP